MNLPINPKKPVAGNAAGTFAGYVATLAAGYVANLGVFSTVAAYFCDNTATNAMVTCDQAEWVLMFSFAAAIGAVVNYATTHWAQARKLKLLWKALPTTYAEFPNDGRGEKSRGPTNGNYNK